MTLSQQINFNLIYFACNTFHLMIVFAQRSGHFDNLILWLAVPWTINEPIYCILKNRLKLAQPETAIPFIYLGGSSSGDLN